MNKLLKIYNFSNFKIKKGQGVFLFDDKNKKYLDFSAGIAVNTLGYNHPLIKKVLKEQLKTGILHLSGSQLHKYKILLSSLLSNLTNKGNIYFCNSGTESVEAALKFSKLWGHINNNKSEIISMQRGFHGRTYGSLSVGSNKYYKTGVGRILSNIKFCQFNNSEHLSKLINPKKTLAIIIEFIQGDGGIYVCNKDFARTIKKICKKYNILLIADEIQSGMGRTGKLFSYEHFGIKPDIITLAKSLGGGYPVAATIVNNKVSKSIKLGKHGSTFGGGMMQTRLAYNILKLINKKIFLKDVTKKGIYFYNKLNLLKNKYPNIIKEIRGSGLMLAIEFKKNYKAKKITNLFLKNGLIITAVGNNSVRITPPLIIKKNEIDLGIKKIKSVLDYCNK